MKQFHDDQYLDLLDVINAHGTKKTDRTGTGTKSIFGAQMRFDLSNGYFPLLTTKKVHVKSVVHELLWFLSGDTNIKYLKDNGVKIWDEWADKNGNLGPVYGAQWRSWPSQRTIYTGPGETTEYCTIDQISNVINQLRTNPDSRRMIVSAWNPAQIEDMALPPCHCLFQFYTVEMSLAQREKWLFHNSNNKELVGSHNHSFKHEVLDDLGVPRRQLSCQLYQRSADMFLGVPFNIASYALLTHMMAHVTGMAVGEFIHTLGDAHIYLNHQDQVKLQLSRSPHVSPHLHISKTTDDIFSITADDIHFEEYTPHPAIKAPVAV